jgi:DNA-binding MarR family transcriptional regulator
VVAEASLIKVVEKISNMMGEFEDKALNSDELSDLTVKQIYYLDIVDSISEPTFTNLASEMDVTKPTVTLAINKLIKQGYVKKEQSTEDRRVYHILLTEKGREVVKVHDQAHRDFAREIVKCLEQDDLEKLVGIFKKIIGCKSS